MDYMLYGWDTTAPSYEEGKPDSGQTTSQHPATYKVAPI